MTPATPPTLAEKIAALPDYDDSKKWYSVRPIRHRKHHNWGIAGIVESVVLAAGPNHPIYHLVPLLRRRRLQCAVAADQAFGVLPVIANRARWHSAFRGSRTVQLFATGRPALEPNTFFKAGWLQWSFDRVVDRSSFEPGEPVWAPSRLAGCRPRMALSQTGDVA